MKKYNVKVTPDAEKDLRAHLVYLNNEKKNPQAVRNVIDDFNETANMLSTVASSIAEPDSEKLKTRGLKRINFKRHNYFLLYYIGADDVVYITNVFHNLEDFEDKLR